MEYQETQSISHKIWPLKLDSEEKASNNILTEVWYVNFQILKMVVDGGGGIYRAFECLKLVRRFDQLIDRANWPEISPEWKKSNFRVLCQSVVCHKMGAYATKI